MSVVMSVKEVLRALQTVHKATVTQHELPLTPEHTRRLGDVSVNNLILKPNQVGPVLVKVVQESPIKGADNIFLVTERKRNLGDCKKCSAGQFPFSFWPSQTSTCVSVNLQ